MKVRIEPFITNLLPSPAGDQVAMTVAWQGSLRGVNIVVASSDGSDWGPNEEIASYETLLPVAMTWDPHGRMLAFAQSESCGIREGDRLHSINPPGPIRQLGFDRTSVLWGVSRDVMWRSSPDDGFIPRIRFGGVLSACTAPFIAAVRRSESKLEIIYDNGAEVFRYPWPLSVQGRPQIRSSPEGGLFISAEDVCGPGRVRFEIAYLNFSSSKSFPFFAGELATGVGWPSVSWSPWDSGSVLLLCEINEHARLFRLDVEGRKAIPVSPDGFEVSAFSGSVQSHRVAITGVPLGDDQCVTESWLLVCDELSRDDCSFNIIRRGVNITPVWDLIGKKLFYVHATSNVASKLSIHTDTRIYTPFNHEGEASDCFSHRPAQTGRAIDLSMAASRSAALIYVQGPHRRFLSGPQSTFFHHALLSLLDEFVVAGYSVSCLYGPGSTGKGRSYREPVRTWLVETKEALADKVRRLKDAGFERIGVVAGSLGGLPALHFLTDNILSAGVLVSPVYHSSIPALLDWQHLFGNATDLAGAAELAHDIRTPLLILHGLCDEMTASENSSRFVSHLAANVPCDYITFPDEGHIFRQPLTWEKGLIAASHFLRRYLDSHSTAI